MKRIFTLCVLVGLMGLMGERVAGQTVTYTGSTSTTTGTWTCPAGVTSVTVECWGAGGGGGGTSASPTAGSGGAGGAYSRTTLTVSPATVYSYSIGASGTVGSNTGGNGGAGGDSWFNTSSTILAKGGSAGNGSTAGGNTAATQSGSIGTVTYTGGSGAAAVSTTSSGAGGGGGGTYSVGGSASTTTAGLGGSQFGGGGAAGKTSSGTGIAGIAPGGGGGGGYRASSTTRTGGIGGAGQITITYNCSSLTYATLPYSTSFETVWGTDCGNLSATDIPDASWRGAMIYDSSGSTYTANTNNIWHRSDYSGSDWTAPTSRYNGAALASNGTYSAMFNTYDAPSATKGALDLAVNLSSTLTKTLTFYYINAESGSTMSVLLSTDGGLTFPTTLATYSSQVSTWTSQSISITASSSTAVIRFIATSDFGSYNLGIDNLSVTLPAACTAPTMGTPTSITSTSASIPFTCTSCSPGNAYIVEYGASGFTPGTGATAGTGGTIVTGTASPIAISGLSASTTYDVYVRQNCTASSNGYSANSGKATFTTLCSATSIPYTQGFNATSSPSCWNQQTVTGTSAIQYVASSSSPTTTPQEGADYVFWNSFSITAGNQTRLVSAPLTTTGTSSVDVNFYWYAENNTSYNSGVYLSEGVQVQYSTDGGTTWTNTGSFIPRHDASLTSGTGAWKNKIITSTAIGNLSNVLIGFLFTSEDGDNCSMDNLVIKATASCLAPTVGTPASITTTSASIPFTCTSCSPGNSYIVEYGAPGFTPGTGATAGTGGNVVTGSSSPVALTGLSSGTTYDLYVRQNCSASSNGFSANSTKATFTTTCTAISSFPWSENFDALTTVGAGILPNCWTTVTGTKAFTTKSASDGYHTAYSTPNYVDIAYGNTTQSTLWAPQFTLTAGTTYSFSFYWAGDANSGWTGTAYVNTSASATGATTLGTFVSSGTITSSSYTQASYTFTATTTGTYYFGVGVVSTSTPYYLGFDNFSVSIPVTYTWTGATNTDWATAGNWSGNTVPSATSAVTIASTTNQPVIGSSTAALCGSIILNSGTTLGINGTLNDAGAWTNNGSAVSGAGTVTMSGSGITIGGSATTTFPNLTIASTGNLSLGINTTVTGNLAQVGVFAVGSSTTSYILTVGGNFTQTAGTTYISYAANNSAMNVTGTFGISAGLFILENSTTSTGATVTVAGAGGTTISGTGEIIMDNAGSAATASFQTTGFTSSGTGNTSNTLDFGLGSTVNHCQFKISGNFSHSSTGVFYTSATTQVGSFIFNGTGTQTFNYAGTNSAYTSYTINSGATLQLLTNLTMAFSGSPSSIFTVNGTIDFQTFSIGGASSSETFILNSGATIKTANTSGVYAASATASTGSLLSTLTARTFNAAANYIFNGIAAQTTNFNSTTAATMANLTINNSAGVTNNAANIVSGLLTFTAGKLTTTTANTLTLTSTANTAISGASATAYINGPLNWALANSTTYLFPVGTGSAYYPYSIALSTGNTTPVLQVSAIAASTGGSANNTTLSAISNTEYWKTTTVSGTFTGGSLSLGRSATLGSLNAIGSSTSLTGAYASLAGVVGTLAGYNSVNNSNTTGAIASGSSLYNVLAQTASYTVTYNGNGSTGGTVPTDAATYAYNATVTVLANTGSLVKTGYTFSGWGTTPTGGTLYAPGATFTITANTTLYAQYTINTYTLTYTAGANGTISGTTPQTVNYGASGTAVTAVPGTGYHFVSWSDGSTANPRTDNNVTANISVTASFVINTYTLTYTAGANGTISGTTPQTVNYGASGTAVTAVPNTGYHFVQWSDGSTTNPRTDNNVTANISVTASFAINTYTLTYTAGANGTISGTTPQTVNYGASGTAVTAVPGTGYHFVSWSDGSTTNPRTDANVMANISVTASFAINTYTLTYTAGANGTISGTTPQTVNYGASGTAVTAVPNTGYHFVQWSDGSTTNPRTDANVTANISVTASFAINTYTLTYTAGANGTISGTTPQTVNYGASGTAVTAVPNTGYYFVQWSDGSTVNPRTDNNVTADISVTATFAINTYTITATAGANGSITPNAATIVNYGGSQAYTITPNTGYHILDVQVDGISDAGAISSGTYTFSNVTANHTISATFAVNTYTITSSAGANGTISPNGSTTVNYGGSQTYTITPNANYGVQDVLVDGVSVGAVTTYAFNNVTANHTISVTFYLATCPNPPTANAGTNGSVCSNASYTLGGSIGGGATSATWSSSGTGTFNGGTTFGSATSYTPSAADAAAGSVIITLTTNNPNPGVCDSAVSSFTLTVNPTTTITAQPAATTTYCQNASPVTALSVTATGTGTLTYQWYSNATNSNTGGTIISGATASTYTPAVTAAGTTYYYVTVTSPGCGAATSNTAAIVVNAATNITSQPAGATYCQNAPGTPLSVTATGGNLTYQWYSNTVNSNFGGALISGAASATYIPSTTTSGTVYYYVIISGICGNITSNTAAIVVTATAAITSQPTGATYCQNATAAALSVTASGSGTLSYQWYSNTTNSYSGGTPISGANSSTYTPSTATVNTTYYYVVVNSSSCGTATSGIAAIMVNATPVPTFTASPAGTICTGSSVTYTTQSGQTSYVWTFSGTAGTDYSITSGGTSTSNTVTLTWITTASKTVTVNYTTGTCTGATPASATNTVAATPVPTFTASPAGTICTGSSVTYTTQSGQSNYVWTFTGTAGTDYSITSGGTSTSSTVTLTWITTGSKTVTVNYTSGTCTGATPASATNTVAVAPVPTFTASPAGTICTGSSVTYTTQSGQSSYAWTFSGTAGTDYSITSGGTSTSNTVTLVWLTTGSKTVTVNYTSGTCTGATPASATNTVAASPVPTFTASPAGTICTGSNVTYTTQGGQSNYVWTFTGTAGTDYSITSGGTSTSNTVTLTWLTTGSKTVTVNYTSGTCTGATPASTTNTVVVPPVPTFTATPTNPVCTNTNATYTTQSGQSSYVWTYSGTAGTDYNIISGGTSTSNTVTLVWLTGGNKTVTVNYSNGTCSGTTPASSAITVNGAPTGPLASNTYTIGSCAFPTIASAASYVNTNGIAGAVIFNVPAGYTETVTTASGIVLGSATLNATLNATNTLKFVKSGTGANPILTAATGVALPSGTAPVTPDGIFSIRGADYITIDGLTFTDNNTSSATTAMEFGIGMFKLSVTDGANNNTIQNCTFNMQRVNNAAGTLPLGDGAVAIGVYNSIATDATTVLMPTATSGANSNNKFYTNTINGGNTGIDIYGYNNATAPYNYTDQNNDIGGSSTSTGNAILNYGGGATTNPAVGIRANGQYGLNLSYNIINNNNGSGINHATTLRGIWLQAALGASETVSNNTITVSSGATTSQLTGIENAAGGTANSNTVNINNNSITTNYTTATSGFSYGVFNSIAPATLNINTNIITLNTSATSASIGNFAIYQTGAVASALNINTNTISENYTAASTSAILSNIYNTGAANTSTVSISNNTFNGFTFSGATGGTGTLYGIYQTGTPLSETISGNNFNNLSVKTTGTIYLINGGYTMPSSGTRTVQGNYITTGFARTVTATNVMYCYYDGAGSSPSGTTTTFSGNNFNNITANTTGTFYGFYSLDYSSSTISAPVKNIYSNSFNNLNTSSASVYLAYVTGYLSTSSIHDNTATGLNTSASSTIYGFYGSSGLNMDIYNNTISGATLTGAASMYSFYYAGSGTSNIYGNTLTNITRSGAGSTYGVYNGGTTANIYNNTITGVTNSTAGNIYGIYTFGTTATIYQNFINTLSSLGSVYGVYVSSGTAVNIYQHQVTTANNYSIYGLSSSGLTTVANGITVAGGTTVNVYKNNIYNISNTSSSTTATSSLVNGMSFTAGTTVNAYNNTIGNLTAPAVSYTDAIRGISVTSATATTSYNVYYNTIYLNASSSGGTFGTTGIYHTASATSTTAKLDLRNNIVVNLSTPGGTGVTTVLRRSAAATLGNFATTSNNNMYYAGTPGTTRTILYDGTNSYQTLSAFQAAVTPRETASFTGEGFNYSTPGSFFISLTGSDPTFLHLVAGITTQAESGAQTITSPSITDDYDGDARPNNTTTNKPDVGADEFVGVTPAPTITLNSFYVTGTTTPGTTTQCTSTGRDVSVTVSTPSGTISSVNITYNNGTSTTTAMTGTTGTSSGTFTYTIPAANPANTTVTWSITATNNSGVSTIYTGASYSDAPLTGVTATATASQSAVCLGNSDTLTAKLNKGGAATIGTGTTLTSSTTYPSAFGNYWYQDWTQMVFTATELQAAGLRAGNITALTFTIAAKPSPTSAGAYSINIGSTTASTLSGFTTTGLTNVYSVSSVTPTVGANTLTFSTPYNWDGTSNILLDIRGTGQDGSANATTYYTTTTGNTVVYAYTTSSNTSYYTSSPTPTATTSRFNVTFTGNGAPTITSVSWSDGTTITSGNPIYVTPTTTGTNNYTATITASGCTTTATTSFTVNPVPTTPTTTNSIQCGTGVPTASASGGTNGQYRWYLISTGGTALTGETNSTLTSYSINTTTTFYVAINNGTCESSRTPVTATVTSPDAVTASASPTAVCIGGSTQLTATKTGTINTYTYTWTCTSANASTSGISTSVTGNPVTVTPSAAGTYTYLVTANDGSTGCTTTSSISINVNALPVITSADASPSITCAGTPVTLTAKSISGTTFSLGQATEPAANLSSLPGYGMYFSSTNTATINSVKIYPSTAGTLNITLENAGGTTVDTRSFTITNADISTTVQKTLNLGFSIPAGSTGWQIDYDLSINRGAGTYTYPQTSNGFSITGNTLDGNPLTTGTRWYFYNWNITAGTDVTSSYNWVWNPGNLSGSTVTINPGPATTTTYTVTATNPGTGCMNTANATVTIVAPLSGTYTVGPTGQFSNLSNAVSAYNSVCIAGPVIFALQSNYTSSTETFPITINSNNYASSTNTLTIKPASGVNATISGSSTSSIIKLNGADYVTIDGSNSGGTDKNLTITNTNAGTSSAGIWIASTTAPDSATNNTVKNVIVSGNTSATTFGDIISSGSVIGAVAEAANNNNTYQNDSLTTAQYGIGVVGSSAGETGTVITGNSIGSTTTALKLGFRGIFISNEKSIAVSSNTITGISSTNTSSTNPSGGIIVVGVISGGSITKNKITDIKNTSSSGWASYGIDLQSTTTTTGLTISNNFISDVAGYGFSSTVADNGFGIVTATGGGYNIYYNSVSLATNQTATAGYSAGLYVESGVTGIKLTNNILSNDETVGNAYSIYSDAASSAFSSIDYNDYNTDSSKTLGYINSTTDATISDIQGSFGSNTHSLSVTPLFVSATDLHLTSCNSNLDGKGISISGITTDIDGDTRQSPPDIGADEFTSINASIAITASPSTPVCAGTNVMLTETGGTATSWMWSTGAATQSITVAPSSTTTYSVTAVTSTCSLLKSIIVNINKLPTAATVTPATSTVCYGGIQTLTASAVATDTLFSQNFNTTALKAIPAGWTSTTVNAKDYWGASNSANAGGVSHEMNYNAEALGSSKKDTIYLQSPVINGTSWSSLNMSFNYSTTDFDAIDYPYTLKLQTSTDGTTWTDRWSATPTSSINANTVTASLSALNGVSAFYFRFAVYGKPYGIFDWYIDNVIISGLQTSTNITWSPTTGLYTDAAATVAYTGGFATTVYAKPTVTTVYTLTNNNGTCSNSSATATVSVSTTPSWTGITSSQWDDATNWCNGLVPVSTTDVIIPTGVPNLPVLDGDFAVHDIVIASGMTLSLNDHTLTLNGAFSGAGKLTGSPLSGLVIGGAAGTVSFTNNTSPATRYNYLKTLTLSSSSSGVTLGDTLNIAPGTFASPGTVTVTGGNLHAGNKLILKSSSAGDAKVAYSTGTISDSVMVERFIPARRAWRFVTAPVNTSQTINKAWQEGVVNPDIYTHYNPNPGFGTEITYDNLTAHGYDVNTTLNPSVKYWNSVTNSWLTPATTNGTNLNAYSAWCLFVRGSRAVDLSLARSAPPDTTVLRAKGVLNETNGAAVITNYPGVAANSYLFVGNPYASPINILSSLGNTSGINQTKFYVWDPEVTGNYGVGAYVSYSGGVFAPAGSTYSGSNYAQSGQGFFVQATSSGTVTTNFQQGDKTGGTESSVNRVMTAPPAAFYTNLMTPSGDSLVLVDGVAAAFGNGYSAAVDAMDANKRWNFQENIALARDTSWLAIEFRPVPVLTDTLFYKLYLYQNQPYALKIFAQNIPAGFPQAWLVDRYLNTKTAFNTGDTLLYNFTPNTDTSSYRSRFILVFRRTLNATPVAGTFESAGAESKSMEGNVSIYPNPVVSGSKILLKFSNMKKDIYEVTVNSIDGKALSKQTIDHQGGSYNYELQLDARWTTGNYIIKTTGTSGYVGSTKLVVGK